MNPIWPLLIAAAVLGLAGVAVILVRDFRLYRNVARREFAEDVGENCPDIVLDAVGPKAIVARVGGRTATLRPQALYLAMSTIDLNAPGAKEEVFKKLADELRSGKDAGSSSSP